METNTGVCKVCQPRTDANMERRAAHVAAGLPLTLQNPKHHQLE